MKAKLGISALLGAVILASTSHASAAGDAKGLGEKYQLIISADRLVPLFAYTRSSISETTPGGIELTDSQTGAGISLLLGRNVGHAESFTQYPVNVHTLPRVAFDFTVIPKLTLGAAIAFGFGLGGSNENEFVQGNLKTSQRTDSPTASAIGLAPRVGYIIGLSDIFAFWPRGGLGFYSVSVKTDIVDNNNPANVRTVSLSDTIFSLDLDPQFVLTPVEHFFFHFGPLINIPITGSRTAESRAGATTTTVSNDISLFHFGITAGLGGWLSL
jgi:hypothetical protein